ncbi:MAG: hypothetical protein ACPGRD_04875 [Planktomarina sp.]
MTQPHKLVLGSAIPAEVVHYYNAETGDQITSRAQVFTLYLKGKTTTVVAPLRKWKKPFTWTRLGRRFSRSDKGNAVLNQAQDGVVILYDGTVFFFDLTTGTLTPTATLTNSRNVLHNGIAVTDHGIFFGEYGHNPKRESVPVWRSVDDGRSWQVVYSFAAGTIKHIHGVYFDRFTDRLWITSGDYDGECDLVSASPDFTDIQSYGDKTQTWRPVSLLFTPTHVVWAMDSPLKPSHLQTMDRATGTVQQGQRFEGSVWYTKMLQDGLTLLQTTIEPGPSVMGRDAILYVSKDLAEWQPVAKFRKDIWPMPALKYGVIGFADGPQTSDDFVLFGEALTGLDGVSYHACLQSK